MSVYDMSEVEFRVALEEKTTPEEVFVNANRIYDYLTGLFEENCADSVLREWAFRWFCDQTGEKYDLIYDEWLSNE